MAQMTAKAHRVIVLKEVLALLDDCRDIDDVYPIINKMIVESEPKPEPDYRAMFQSLDRGNKR
ncbi:hypothetical protein NVP1055O_47 [Vibrio phage 1.055.O._10N.286.55.E9]|nr:hypothetical protein NVP1055O_47 [Vibrio phage 1.055.O._10N.286.55.E9]